MLVSISTREYRVHTKEKVFSVDTSKNKRLNDVRETAKEIAQEVEDTTNEIEDVKNQTLNEDQKVDNSPGTQYIHTYFQLHTE